jgi:hypothetical protein
MCQLSQLAGEACYSAVLTVEMDYACSTERDCWQIAYLFAFFCWRQSVQQNPNPETPRGTYLQEILAKAPRM